ncbi:Yta7 protein [Hanseniaspora uvarum]|nr:Yta7 protein [Hanseniaspora uvarum]
MSNQVDYLGNPLDDFDNNKISGNSTYNTDDIDDSRHRLRSRQPVDYKTTKYIDDHVDEDESGISFDDSKVNQQPRHRSSRRNNDVDESNQNDEEEDEEVVSRRTRRSNTQKTYFEESDSDEEESEEVITKSRRKRKDDFEEEYQVTSDSELDDYDYNYNNKRRKKTYNSRPSTRAARYKKHAALNNFIDDDEEAEESLDEDSLVDDLNDLADEQEQFESPKRHLRERSKKVDYKLPPPDSDINVFNKFNRDILENQQEESPRKNKKKANTLGKFMLSGSEYPARRLYQTSGPFGGNNTISLINKFDHAKKDLYQEELLKETFEKKEEIKTKIIKADLNQPLLLPPNQQHAKNKNYTPKVAGMDSDSSSSGDEQVTADTDPIAIPKETSFDDIGGFDNYITQLKEMITLPLLYPELYTNFNIQPPRGVLFHGPPGTGKTLMARALAAQSSKDSNTKITFYMRKGSDILSKWVGEAERQLRLLFEQAISTQPSIIFFDELDGLAPVRSSKQEQIHSSIVSTLLALMDGMDSRGQVVVIGATNRPDSLDPALRRGGRFDREFYFGLPSKEARFKILQIHTKDWKNLNLNLLEQIADLTNGFGGADLKQLCVEAALTAVMRTYPQIYRKPKDIELSKKTGRYQIDVTKVIVGTMDFNAALEKINPSSARQGGAASYKALPVGLSALLGKQENKAQEIFKQVFPIKVDEQKNKSMIDFYLENELLDNSLNNLEFIKSINNSRFNKPLMYIEGTGSDYIANSILHGMDNVNIQSLDIGSLFSDLGKTMEQAIITAFNEAKRRQPSILYVPNADTWSVCITNCQLIFKSMMQSIKSSDKVMVLFSGQTYPESLDYFFVRNKANVFQVNNPDRDQLQLFFMSTIGEYLKSGTTVLETSIKRNTPLPELPFKEDQETNENSAENDEESKFSLDPLKKYLEIYKKSDMKLKNKLKVKLAGLMDLLKIRYKKFKKPLIEDELLIPLFETNAYHTPVYEIHNNLVKDTTTNVSFSNMDLDTIEERLWNGFYSEPKQFFKDILLIYDDAIRTGIRDKVISASEMVANSDVFIDEMLLPNEQYLTNEWKECKKRDDLREKLKIIEGVDVFIPESEEQHQEVPNNESQKEEEEVIASEAIIPEAVEVAEVVANEVVDDIEMEEVSKVDSEVVISKVICDEEKLANLIEALSRKCEHKSIDLAQQCVADILNKTWKYRLNNDKSESLNVFEQYIKEFS